MLERRRRSAANRSLSSVLALPSEARTWRRSRPRVSRRSRRLAALGRTARDPSDAASCAGLGDRLLALRRDPHREELGEVVGKSAPKRQCRRGGSSASREEEIPARSTLAEREGFEPSSDGTARTGFRDRRRSEEKPISCREFVTVGFSVGKPLGKSAQSPCTHRWRTLSCDASDQDSTRSSSGCRQRR